LGAAYIPQQYRNAASHGLYQPSGVNLISASVGSSSNAHKAFQTTSGQGVHCDGTIEEMGAVSSVILLCLQPSRQGGESTIFNSTAAFFKLMEIDPDAARALQNPNALRRVDVGRSEAARIGPAFEMQPDGLKSRFSLDHTSDWDYGIQRVANLDRAYDWMKSQAEVGTPYFLQFQLEAGQGIVMANDRIAHGRLAFTDDLRCPRKMVRGLYADPLKASILPTQQ
jgi:hypothetical protein